MITLRAAIYVRVSTEEQARTGFSLADQAEKCRARAVALGAAVVFEAVDPGVSGEKLDRPGLSRIREAVKGREVDLVIIYDPDRLSRRLAHQLIVTEEIEKAGCRLEFVNFEWKNTPEGRLFYSLRGAVAEFEKEKIRERTINGRIQGARQGRFTARPSWYGYGYDKTTKDISVCEPEATVVRQMYTWLVDLRLNPSAIARKLAELGAEPPRGRFWYTASVVRILRNEVYAGTAYNHRLDRPKGSSREKLRPKSEWIPVQVPAIVERETWERAQRIIDGNRTIRRDNGDRPEFLLRGLLQSADCGGYTTKTTTCRKTGRRYGYYICAKKLAYRFGSELTPCRCRQLAALKIDDMVWDQLVWVLNNPREIWRQMKSESPKVMAGEITGVDREVAFWERKKERTVEAFTMGWMTRQVADKAVLEAERKITELAARREDLRLSMESNSNQLKMQDVARFCRQMVESLELANFRTKREIVKALVEEVEVDGDDIRIIGRFDERALGTAGGSLEWVTSVESRTG